jgi:hypothetical protein
MIEQRARQLLDKEGFIEAYYEGIRAGMGCKESFEYVNREFFIFFGRPRYSDYRSFASSRDYSVKKSKKVDE